MGLGMIVSTDNPLDLDRELLENTSMRIETFEGNEASITLPGKRTYRVKMRPPLSSL
jgi:hypothetical protein